MFLFECFSIGKCVEQVDAQAEGNVVGREGHCWWGVEDVVDDGGQPHFGVYAQQAKVDTQPGLELEAIGGHILRVGGTDGLRVFGVGVGTQ